MPDQSENGSQADKRADAERRLSWAEWKQEVFDCIQELDKACANARQVIYRLRPQVRPRTQSASQEPAAAPVPLRRQRRSRRDAE